MTHHTRPWKQQSLNSLITLYTTPATILIWHITHAQPLPPPPPPPHSPPPPPPSFSLSIPELRWQDGVKWGRPKGRRGRGPAAHGVSGWSWSRQSRCNKPKSLYATNTTIVILATLKALSVVFIAQAFTPKTLFLATPMTLSSSKNYYSSTMYPKNTIPINDHAK